ncbi:MAG TPA: hypothetical protein VLH08_15470 [Acidobacteriota bacterium]|nr:hypothetical protein [Acidobacteriota bacterium]
MRVVKILVFVALLFIGTFFSLFLLEMLVHDHYHRKMDEIRQNEEMNQKKTGRPVQPQK